SRLWRRQHPLPWGVLLKRTGDPRRSATLRLLDEVVDELRRRVGHLDVQVLEAAGEVVVEPHGRNRDDQTERGLDERLGDTARDGAEAARARSRDAVEGVDNADRRAEQT